MTTQSSVWTDELKKQIVDEYLASDPTPQNSPEIVNTLAESFEKSPNGVRLVLTQAGVYLKKEPATKTETKDGVSTGTKRVSKESAIAELREAIKAKGAEVDDSILEKLTGKAAVYFTSVLKS